MIRIASRLADGVKVWASRSTSQAASCRRASIDVLLSLISERGASMFPRSDNGPEFASKAILQLLAEAKIETALIDQGKPVAERRQREPARQGSATNASKWSGSVAAKSRADRCPASAL